MGDHYCCKRCHQGFGECECVPEVKNKTVTSIKPEKTYSILKSTTDAPYYDAKHHLTKPISMMYIPCSFCGRHPCECAKAGWPFTPTELPKGPVLTREQIEKIMQDAKSEIKDKTKTEAVKADSGKLDWSLLPIESVEEIIKVLEFGATKYDDWNWSTGEGFKYTRVFNATMRHLWAWFKGEDNDPETGLSHWAHAGCNVLFMLHFIKNKSRYNQDDRKFFRAK